MPDYTADEIRAMKLELVRENVIDWPGEYLSSLGAWLDNAHPDTMRTTQLVDPPADHPMMLARAMLCGDSDAWVGLTDAFEKSAAYRHMLEVLVDTIDRQEAIEALDDAARDAAEIAETEASLMPGRV